jgi:hypothetical protein
MLGDLYNFRNIISWARNLNNNRKPINGEDEDNNNNTTFIPEEMALLGEGFNRIRRRPRANPPPVIIKDNTDKDAAEEFIAVNDEENPEPNYKGFILNPYSRKLI